MDGLKIAAVLVLLALYAAYFGVLWLLTKKHRPSNDEKKARALEFISRMAAMKGPKEELDEEEKYYKAINDGLKQRGTQLAQSIKSAINPVTIKITGPQTSSSIQRNNKVRDFIQGVCNVRAASKRL